MSNIYIHEPPTAGKVLLYTSVGDIDIELWSKEAPKACRNFVQLCMEGYYDNTIFHRVVKGFIAQGGDPTGSGHGGESVYGKPFRDEIHSRLRFNRRGLVAMANAGPNDNGSQFFFTFSAAPELDKKHTIFGKVAGSTIYNMLKLEDLEVNSEDRPVYPPTLNKTKILHNPFEDIEPRALPKRKKESDEPKKKRNKSRATKNFSLLSFGEEAEEDEEEVNKVSQDLKTKSKSSHDLLEDDNLSTVPAVASDHSPSKTPTDTPQAPSPSDRKRSHDKTDSEEEDDPEEDDDKKRQEKEATMERIRKKLKKDTDSDGTQSEKVADEKPKDPPKNSSEKPSEQDPEKLSKIEQLRKEAKELKKDIQGSKKEKEKEIETAKSKKPKIPQNEVISAYEEERKKYEDRKISKKKDSRESETLSILSKFQSRLSAARSMTAYDDEDDAQETKKAEEEEEEDDPNDLSWMNHKLNFEGSNQKVLDANIQDEDRYEIYDPRNPMNKRRREASKHAMKDKR